VTAPQKQPRGSGSAARGDREPQRGAPDPRTTHDPRTPEQRTADHKAIDRLAEELLPALVAKLAASGLAEIEIGEGSWTIRVRRPADAVPGHGRRLSDRASRSQPGHAGHGHAPGGFEGHRSARDAKPAPASAYSGNGSNPAVADPAVPGSAVPGSAVPGSAAPAPTARSGDDSTERGDRYRVVATSPAVGVFLPRPEAKAGTRVRSGDRLGAIDMLGIAQEVVAPADGVVGARLVESGQTVEYGQELVIIELAGRPAERGEA
jgi:biotin carboxyl carrier protein